MVARGGRRGQHFERAAHVVEGCDDHNVSRSNDMTFRRSDAGALPRC